MQPNVVVAIACKDSGMGWHALKRWGPDAQRIEKFTTGIANDVWSVRVNGELFVGRLGMRSDADLAWEASLLQYLHSHDIAVPRPIPTTDGDLFADGLMVMTYVEGRPPESEDDWRRVADVLRHIHELTKDIPQRPGWRSSVDLLTADSGTKIDLSTMPAEAVIRCRAAWARLAERPTCVVHGDPNNVGNILITDDRVGLVDWDEAHVDAPALDLVLPENAGGLSDAAFDVASQASAAWEAAVCWDDEHAKHQLAQVREV